MLLFVVSTNGNELKGEKCHGSLTGHGKLLVPVCELEVAEEEGQDLNLDLAVRTVKSVEVFCRVTVDSWMTHGSACGHFCTYV
jgi:hypothetical protein